MKAFALSILLYLCINEPVFAQFGIITFNNLEYSYQFSDTSFNTTVWIDGGVTIDTNRGIIRFEIPFSPIESSVGVNFTKYLNNSSTAFTYGGLLDGEYDFEKNGVYPITGRGLMQVNDSNKGRAYPAETTLKVTGKTLSVRIVVPIKTTDYGFNENRINERALLDEFFITITGETALR